MPSGKTHDAITFLLAAPIAGAAWAATADTAMTAAVAGAFLFGGLMFGPDLDTLSDQYSRWRLFRPFWLPYRTMFKHRSRWSHGLIFGTLFRVVYFLGALTLAIYTAFLIKASITGGKVPDTESFLLAWRQLGETLRGQFGDQVLPSIFGGLWIGAASHTFTDMAVTYVKIGRVTEFL
ncbi:MAG: metal-binding protein [Acidobacteria bacterium]|nr:metal-binding protein [Acidobacteriota bacterium]